LTFLRPNARHGVNRVLVTYAAYDFPWLDILRVIERDTEGRRQLQTLQQVHIGYPYIEVRLTMYKNCTHNPESCQQQFPPEWQAGRMSAPSQ
jgi:hypothetical protein